MLTPEFPEGADSPPDGMSRRTLLTLLGASAALAGAGCSRGPAESIVPYVRTPPEVTPSIASAYATTMTLGGYGTGLVVESHEGRPTKAEGNPEHPASLGSLGTLAQACVLGLYDPSRAGAILHGGSPATWQDFVRAVTAAPGEERGVRQQVHVLLEPTSAPHLIDRVLRARAQGIVVHYDAPLARQAAWEASLRVFGRTVEIRPDFRKADVIVAFDADFLDGSMAPPAWARAWGDRRRGAPPREGAGTPSRLYAVEPRLTVTGMSADERLRVPARDVRALAAALLARVLADKPGGAARADAVRAARSREPLRAASHAAWVEAVARDLVAHAGASLVLAGEGQPESVHRLVYALNEALGNAGRTVTYGPCPIHDAGGAAHGLAPLVHAIDAGEVATLIVVGGNPAYTAPADLDFARRIAAVRTTAFVGPYDNETARACAWFVPEAHFLESWSDARAFDGTASIVQPLVRPLHPGKTPAQILAVLAGSPEATSLDLVRSYWHTQAPGDAGAYWERALVRGVVADSADEALAVDFDWSSIGTELSATAGPTSASGAAPGAPGEALEVVFFADAKVNDGRFADNPWLQELADPVTKLTWDNAALLSPATASRYGVANEDVVAIEVRGRSVRAPVLVIPGTADGVVAIALGYGQADAGRVSSRVGANAYAIRHSFAPWFDDAALHKTGETMPLALTQEHWSMEGRPLVLTQSLAEYRSDPEFAARKNETPPTLYAYQETPRPGLPVRSRSSPQWGMTIDLNACTGCSACVVACMAENNIPVVGKGGVRLSREMHWIRIDRYFGGSPDRPAALLQPMLCQHCEKAPCEYVCPVNATVHSPDGLNEMVYNRCVGTRFCSNNCPYKVRRFNFFNYNAGKDETRKLGMNPDVTVRARGVMEKCTYCVQRIREAEIRARCEERPIRDMEVVTACQATCPAGAIAFGDIADETTRVAQTRRDPRLYEVLGELGTLPRTRYLTRITNPNPEIA